MIPLSQSQIPIAERALRDMGQEGVAGQSLHSRLVPEGWGQVFGDEHGETKVGRAAREALLEEAAGGRGDARPAGAGRVGPLGQGTGLTRAEDFERYYAGSEDVVARAVPDEVKRAAAGRGSPVGDDVDMREEEGEGQEGRPEPEPRVDSVQHGGDGRGGPDSGGDAGGPSASDAEIVGQMNAIRAGVEETQPLVGELESAPFASLHDEYSSRVWQAQVASLVGKGYRGLRRVRGDGNCFLRAFAVAYMGKFVEERDLAGAARARDRAKALAKSLKSAGFEEMVTEDFLALFVGQLEWVVSGGATADALLQRFRDPETSNGVVFLLRLAISAEMRRRDEFYAPFLEHPDGVPGFCRANVEPMGEECDHPHIMALCSALRIRLRVEYMDGRSDDVSHIDFEPLIDDEPVTDDTDIDDTLLDDTLYSLGDPEEDEKHQSACLLYRPGHYDILIR